MTETFITIQDAAEISGKSIQTIRRALKGNKIIYKRKRTPQGFNYLLNRESLLRAYKLQSTLFERERAGLGNTAPKSDIDTTRFAAAEDLQKLKEELNQSIENYKNDKENFMLFIKAFQDRCMVMENQLKMLEKPRKKWFQFWKSSVN